MVVFFLTRTNRSNLKANKTDLYEVISKKLKKLGKFVDLSLKRFPWSTKYHKRFQSSLIRKVLCAVSKNWILFFLPSFLSFFFTSFSRANYDAPWRCSTRRWKRFRGKFLHGARLKLMTPRGVKKALFFFSLVAKGNKGFAFTLLPSPPARKGKSTVIARLHFNALGTRPKNVSKGFLLCGQIFAPTNG